MGSFLFLLCAIVFAAGAEAQSFDGNYVGKIGCGVLTGVNRLLSGDFSIKVAGGRATYEGDIVRPSGAATARTGSFERGTGTVPPSGEVTLQGKGEGSSAAAPDSSRGPGAGRLAARTRRARARSSSSDCRART